MTGLTSEGAAHLRLEATRTQFWRAAVRDGVASFPAVPAGTWRAVLECDEREEGAQEVEVAAGEGQVEVRWTPRR